MRPGGRCGGRAGGGAPFTLIYCTAATKDACPARKPGTGMWDFYTTVARPPAAPPVEAASSFYCGDAAGRGVGENTATPADPDFADSDAAFAAGAGLEFKVPEDVFGPAEGLDDFEARVAAAGKGDAAAAAAGSPDRESGGGPGGSGNAALAFLFRRLAARSEGFKAVAFNRAAKAVEALDDAITDFAAFKKTKVPGIGKSCLALVEEWLNTGDIAAAHAPKPPPAPAQEGHGALAFA